MDEQRPRPPVVAVFGGNTVTEPIRRAARVIAEAVLEAGALLLTGGDGGDGPGVKDQARHAVAGRGRWVGIAFGQGRPGVRHTDDGLVLDPGLGHQRNLLEAHLCDAAIVLPGGIGTVSETLATLGLGRPVLLLGTSWDGVDAHDVLPPLLRGEHVADTDLEQWCSAAERRVRGPSRTLAALSEQVLRPETVRRGAEHVESGHRSGDGGVCVDEVRTWTRGVDRLPGRWPPGLDDGPSRALAETYLAWCGEQTRGHTP